MIIVTRNYSVHNSSVCLTENGRLRFFIEEERLDRIKHYKHKTTSGYGELEISKGSMNRFQKGHVYCCENANISPDLYYFLHDIPLNEIFSHHLAHAAATFYSSPFDEAYIITLDGMGAEYKDGKVNFQTSGWYYADKNGIKNLNSLYFPNSMGLFYSSFTDFVNLGEFAEGKLMGLAPYGDNRFDEEILSMINLNEDGTFQINPKFFAYTPEESIQFIEENLAMRTSVKFERKFGEKRDNQNFINGHFEHLAHSAQNALEKVAVNMLKGLPDKEFNLCMGGGVFLNCPVNSLLRKQPQVKDTFIFPAADDSGLSYGYNILLYNELKHLSDKQYEDLLQLLYFDKNKFFFEGYLGKEENFVEIIESIKHPELKFYFNECLDSFRGIDVKHKIKAKNQTEFFSEKIIENSQKFEKLKKSFLEKDFDSCIEMLKDSNLLELTERFGYLSKIITSSFMEHTKNTENISEFLINNLEKIRIHQIKEITAFIANKNMQDIISQLEVELIEKRKDKDLILFLLFLYKMMDKKHNFLSLWRKDFRFIDDVFFYMIRAAYEQKQYDSILEEPLALDRIDDPDLLWILCQIYYEMGDIKSSEKFLNKIPEPDFEQQVMREILESVKK